MKSVDGLRLLFLGSLLFFMVGCRTSEALLRTCQSGGESIVEEEKELEDRKIITIKEEKKRKPWDYGVIAVGLPLTIAIDTIINIVKAPVWLILKLSEE